MRTSHRALAFTLALLASTITLSAPAIAAPATAATGVAACPSIAGDIVTRPGYPWYLIDAQGRLRGIPPGVPERIFKSGVRPRTDVVLETCAPGEDLSQDASIITAGDQQRPWYLYTKGKKYGLRPGIPEKYQLDGAKLKVMPASILDNIPDGGLWD